MAPFSTGSGRQRLWALVLVCGAIFCDASAAIAKTAPVDRDRALASLALASHYWNQAASISCRRVTTGRASKRPSGGEDDPYNIVGAIAVATLNANPGREDAVFKYLNEALLPFALSHRTQYVCLVAEVFYNSQSSTDELKAQTKASASDSGVAIAFIDYAYFLIKTEPARDDLKLTLPANNGIPGKRRGLQENLEAERRRDDSRDRHPAGL